MLEPRTAFYLHHRHAVAHICLGKTKYKTKWPNSFVHFSSVAKSKISDHHDKLLTSCLININLEVSDCLINRPRGEPAPVGAGPAPVGAGTRSDRSGAALAYPLRLERAPSKCLPQLGQVPAPCVHVICISVRQKRCFSKNK